MENRDQFQRSAGTAPLGRAPTRPLQLNHDRRDEISRLVTEARPSLQKFRERIEVLMRTCEEASVKIPGVERQPYRFPLSLKGEQIMHYLLQEFENKPELVQAVQTAVFRYHEAVRSVEAGEASLIKHYEEPGLLEELRRNLFYFSRCYLSFKDDPVLSQLFPPPQTVKATSTKPVTTAERVRAKLARDVVLLKVEGLLASLRPRMEVINQALGMTGTGGLKMGAFLSPEARKARVTALVVLTDPEAQSFLKEAAEAFAALEKEYASVQGGKEDLGALKEAVATTSRHVISCQRKPTLADLLPLAPATLFPKPEDLDS